MGSVTMGMTYGHIAHRDKDPVLDKAHEFIDIVSRITTPEKAALFGVFPFREYLDAVYVII
jgi:Cft2 family RNA processing exonuclease